MLQAHPEGLGLLLLPLCTDVPLSVPQASPGQLSPLGQAEPAAETWVCGAGRALLLPSRITAGIPITQLCRGLHHQLRRVVGDTRDPAPSRVSRPGGSFGVSMQPSAPQEWAGPSPGLPAPGGSGGQGCNAWQGDALHAQVRTPSQCICLSMASDISKAGGHQHHPAFRSSICDSTPKLVCQGRTSPCKTLPQESCTGQARSWRWLCASATWSQGGCDTAVRGWRPQVLISQLCCADTAAHSCLW